ncbi:MFS transporter [Veronia nyctiphanis]|uniref:MFS transporter n=1 Tax=Veronia nyctiphanis TaxID=1278244 RepID=A0A4Q0YP70_9GAMM|nr:MFS transporter [Veronia nyctiphanis]RXJ71744.1 MFS transporter [Veronia nyctiphanis]
MKKQESLFEIARVKRFNLSIWAVLIGTLLARTSYFMAWPFLVVFLYNDYGATAFQVGAMLATSAVVGSITGLYSGYLSDKFGRRGIMTLGAAIAMLSYAGIGSANELWQFPLLLIFTGLMRPMIEAPAKAVLGDNLEDRKDRELAMNIRYFLLNLGGALGPLIGITLALAEPQHLFHLTGATYFVYAIWIFTCIKGKPAVDKNASSQLPNFKDTVKVISEDKIFTRLLFANFLMMFVYSQLESSLPQVIVRLDIPDAASLIAGLVLVNAITIIVFQFPLLKKMEHIPLFKRTRIGMALMGLAQIGFILTPADWPTGWLIACFVLSIGEVIAFPTLGVQIDQLAPPHLRGSYFGATGLCALGFAAGPIVGGAAIDNLSPAWLFAGCGLLCLTMIWLYLQVEKRTQETEQEPSVQGA